jgi:hypothetical protein
VSPLRVIAAELRERSVRVEAIGDQLVVAASQALWTSIAADAFRARVARRRTECAHAAGLLRSAAGAIDAFDLEVAAVEARLRRMEHDVEAVAVASLAGLRVLW